jgi:hypothetical protein
MGKSPKDNILYLAVSNRNHLHEQDRIDYLFEELKDAIADYCTEDQEALELLEQTYYRLHEACDWWDKWKG